MPDTLQAIARNLSEDVRALSAISHNVANLHTPGYRAARAVPDFGRTADVDANVRAAIDQRDGALLQTDRALDLALRGEGFFVVEREGRLLLARGGAFRLDRDGRLVTAAGDAVQGQSGPLVLPNEKIRVGADGAVTADGRDLGQLQIVAAADGSRLRPAGGGAYVYGGPLSVWSGRVVQGALENANVDAAEETVRLMELTRHAESVQRAISIYDKAMGTGIGQIGGN